MDFSFALLNLHSASTYKIFEKYSSVGKKYEKEIEMNEKKNIYMMVVEGK